MAEYLDKLKTLHEQFGPEAVYGAISVILQDIAFDNGRFNELQVFQRLHNDGHIDACEILLDCRKLLHVSILFEMPSSSETVLRHMTEVNMVVQSYTRSKFDLKPENYFLIEAFTLGIDANLRMILGRMNDESKNVATGSRTQDTMKRILRNFAKIGLTSEQIKAFQQKTIILKLSK